MSAVYLLVLVTTAQLLLCGHAAYVERPNWEDGIPYSQYRDINAERLNTIQAQFDPYDAEGFKHNLEHPQEIDSVMDMQLGEDNPDDGYSLATTQNETCMEAYKTKMTELLEKRKECKASGFDDCCQIKNLVGLAANGTYEFHRFCNVPCEPFSSVGKEYTLHGYCDMDTDNGGWLLIQRRTPAGNVDFSRTLEEYETGFGDLNGEFWYGLRNLHCLTSRNDVELRIDAVAKSGVHVTTTFDTFKVGGAGEKYRLTLGGGKGHNSNHIQYHSGLYFTTKDQDNDRRGGNCATLYSGGGGWWYSNCAYAYFNGIHGKSFQWSGIGLLASVEIKVRPKKCLE